VAYRGTSLIRNSAPLGPYIRTMPRALWWSKGAGLFLISEVPLSTSHRSLTPNPERALAPIGEWSKVSALSLGFEVWGLGFGVEGVGFGIQGLECRVRVWGVWQLVES